MVNSSEIWIDLPRVLVAVSNLGRIKNLCTGRIRAPNTHSHGYKTITLRREGTMRTFYIHRLVCEAFHGTAPKGCECDHINYQRDDNRAENLRWIPSDENKAHRRFANGERNGAAKLKANDVIQIRALFPRMTNRAISQRFPVSETTIGQIRRGELWR